MNPARPRLVCLVGPTASGKTALGVALAERLGAEIVSADSRQVYRRFDIGTAKPTAEERARVPHHCVDLVDPTALFDVAQFRAAAGAAVADVARRGRRVLVVGGTGLYVRALLRGLCAAPPRDAALRAELVDVPAAELHRRLAEVDPTAAARLHPNDRVRTVRALEVALAGGVPLSKRQADHRFADAPFEALVIGLAPAVAELEARIRRRARGMLDAGFLDEVRRLMADVPPEAPAWRTVGYREMRACLEGRLDVEAALAATVQATRQFAKRQRTWFRREPDVLWHDPATRGEAILAAASAFWDGAPPSHPGA